MEILALLLLGLIAMLAIVPPIIRGKLEDSPLVTTESFQRSMQEIAHSLEPQNPQGRPSRAASREHFGRRTVPAPIPSYRRRRGGIPAKGSRRRASVRRNRILASLTVLTIAWGAATLLSGNMICLVIFALCGCLLAVYWALTLILPNASSPAVRARESEHTVRQQKRRLA